MGKNDFLLIKSSNFLKNVEIWCLGLKYRSEIFRNRKSIPDTYFQTTCMKGKSPKMKKVMYIIYQRFWSCFLQWKMKLLWKEFIFSKSTFQPAFWKYVSGVLFWFRNISDFQSDFGSIHQKFISHKITQDHDVLKRVCGFSM